MQKILQKRGNPSAPNQGKVTLWPKEYLPSAVARRKKNAALFS
jgi:hypothetical protein